MALNGHCYIQENYLVAVVAMGRVVIRKEEFLPGAPMESKRGVRDWKIIYPETGFENKTLVLGLVEVDPGHRTPLHRHNCEEVYYILEGEGEVEVEGERYKVRAGDAVYIKENLKHRIFNTHPEKTLRYIAVGGIMLVGLLPKWPTPSPYEILE